MSQTQGVQANEFTWDDPCEAVWYGIPVNVEYDSMVWFMSVVLDMETTDGTIGDSYWSEFHHDLLTGQCEYEPMLNHDYATLVFSTVQTGV